MEPRPPDDDLLLAALRILLLLPLRREAEDEFAVDLAELAVEAATGGIPLAAAAEAAEGPAGLGGRLAAGYSRSIREDSLAAPTPIGREGEKGDYERAGKMSGKDRE